MVINFKGFAKKVGLPPGTILHKEEAGGPPVKVTVIDYDEKTLNQKVVRDIEECFSYRDSKTVSWINVDGIHDTHLIEQIDGHFGVHPLVLEDIANTEQRPKVEDYGDYMFIVLKMLQFNEETSGIDTEQVSLVLGKNYVISFQEREGDVFGYIRSRIEKGKGRIRVGGADYLAYALMDAIVDHYYVVLEKLGDRIDRIEEKLLNNVDSVNMHDMHKYKRDMVYLRRHVWPLREVVNLLLSGDSKLVQKQTHIYLRDVYDHVVQVVDAIESYRDILSGLHDVYLSTISNRMNEVMKVLTIFAAIFIPLTFVAGIYGMNFENIPELHFRNGYYYALGVMFLIALTMLFYFKRKKWL